MESDQDNFQTIKKASIITSGDRILQHDLIKLVTLIGKEEIIQISAVGNEIRLNLQNAFDLNKLDRLKNSLLRPNLLITGSRYAGKK